MSIKHWLSLVTLLCLQAPALAAHSGSAPMEPYPTSDERFSVDTDRGLDTGCTFRDGGPLVFGVKIDRYVGAVKGDGTLANPQLLIEKGVISRSIALVMPAYDIDLSDGEVDEVYFNGHKLDKPLQGTNGTWYENQYSVPIEWVKFPAARGIVGSDGNMRKPAATDNLIWIDIDTRGEGWCTAIDWAQVHFKAMAPLILIHGIADTPEQAWEVEPGVTEYLTSLGIPFEHRIQLGPNNLIFPDPNRNLPGNAQILQGRIRAAAQSFGVQNVHLVGHSKGGLDSRGYLRRFYNPEQVRVLSLHTITTPHQGSVLADISTEARQRFPRPVAGTSEPIPDETENDIQSFLDADFWLRISGQGPRFPGLANLQTGFMRDFNRDNPFPQDIKLYTYGADADANGDHVIDDAEIGSLLPGSIPFMFDRVENGNVSYHLSRDVSSITVIEVFPPNPIGFPTIPFANLVIPTLTTSPQLNDIIVTDNSSNHPSQQQHFGPQENVWLRNNHRNIKEPRVMNSILNTIRNDFPAN